MEGNSVSTSGLEWENLALYSGKPIEFQEQMCFSMSSSSGSNGGLCRNDLGTGSSREAIGCPGKMGSLPPYKNTYEDVLGVQNIRGPGEPMIGLRLGRPNGDSFFHAKSSVSSLPASSTPPTKRSRASFHNVQNPFCQVEGCNLDLKSAKDYHRRHRICESHSKSPKVIVAGMERRFCQQCSRFHDLSEFDDKKRSCRRRLSDHNARRRRVQPESIQLSSTGLSSALYDQRLQQNLLLNGLPISNTNPSWENASNSMLRHARDSFVRPKTLCFSSDEIHNSMSSLQMDSNPRNILDQCLHVSTTNSSHAPDLRSAHSLLSSNSWSLNEGDSSSMEGLVQGHYDSSIRHMNPDSHHLTLFHSNNIPVTPVSLVNSVNFHNHTMSAHQHEYQLFKASYNTGGGFYSDERNL